VRRKQAELPPEALRPVPLITGRDLIAAGFRPGPAFGSVLAQIEDAQLEGNIKTPEAARALALALMAECRGTA
jgi:poly(A) polymerase